MVAFLHIGMVKKASRIHGFSLSQDDLALCSAIVVIAHTLGIKVNC
jgi:hypothetical protein